MSAAAVLNKVGVLHKGPMGRVWGPAEGPHGSCTRALTHLASLVVLNKVGVLHKGPMGRVWGPAEGPHGSCTRALTHPQD
jgi:hypothetical protein